MADPAAPAVGTGMQLAGRRRDGSTFPAEVSLSAIETDEGLLVTSVVRDVTERLEIAADGSGCAPRPDGTRWNGSCTSPSGWKASASSPAG